MITLIMAAAAAAAQPAGTPVNPSAHEVVKMSPEQHAEHATKEGCCCEEMAKHEGHDSAHRDHGAQQQQ